MTSMSLSLSLTPKSRHFSLSSSRNFAANPPPTTINNILNLKQQQQQPPFLLHLPSHGLRYSRVRVRVRVTTRASSSSGIDVPSSSFSIKPGKLVESDKLPTDVRKRTMAAIDSFGRRVTIGDVASKAGLKLDQAQMALQALAADTDGFLEVSDEGDVLYVFPKDYRSKLAGKSFRMKIEPWAEKAKSASEYLVRVSFGTTLIASIVIVATAIIAILASGESKDKDNRRSRGSRSYASGDLGADFVVRYFSPRDLFWYWDRDYYRKPRRRGNSEGMTFVESVFSFVLGDGNPNQGIEEERWKLIGQYITSNGGVVTAEELAPYLDVQTQEKSDESYILPVLLRFDGQPEVDEEGNILYRFPSLQRTASTTGRGQKRKEYAGKQWIDSIFGDGRVEKFFEERKWKLSNTSAEERTLVIALGALNLFGVIILGTMLRDMAIKPSGYIAFVASILPLLQVYAGSFFAIPLFRWFFIRKENAEIEKRNQARKLRAKALELPDVSLRRKILNARAMAERTVIGKERIVYSTDKDLDEQGYEERDWEKRFQELERSD